MYGIIPALFIAWLLKEFGFYLMVYRGVFELTGRYTSTDVYYIGFIVIGLLYNAIDRMRTKTIVNKKGDD